MSSLKEFNIELSSRHEEWWRYNAFVTCRCYGDDGGTLQLVSAKSEVAPAGSNLKSRPKETEQHRRLELTTPPCHHIDIHAYIIPHTMPADNDVHSVKRPHIDLRITCGGKVLISQQHDINPWSGATVEVKEVASSIDN